MGPSYAANPIIPDQSLEAQKGNRNFSSINHFCQFLPADPLLRNKKDVLKMAPKAISAKKIGGGHFSMDQTSKTFERFL
ncbi:MAG: hypothetical protein CM15mP12_5630 [Gammaproteobacteria bacterium]|nr:MAG: hypothetical protein CM15mP12_5630 [Gammaproteobacteria bacterium]